jgi:hypothetical protein
MSYTVQKNLLMDQQVDRDLQVITNRLQSEFEEMVGLVLVGGFGRGEGGLMLQNGQYRPENDYDFEMITNESVDTKKLHLVERHLAKELGVKWVHIESRQKQSLPNLPFTQYVYDLKYGARVIYGPNDLLQAIPQMHNTAMPLCEGEKLLHTRLWCFLGAYSAHFETRQPTEDEASFLISQMSKALLAICDAHLILQGDYQVKYANKSQHFLNNIPASEDLKNLIRWATQYKLNPDEADKPNPIHLYQLTRTHFLATLFNFAQNARKTRFNDWMDYGENFHGWVTPTPRRTRLKRYIKKIIGRQISDGRYEDLVRLKLYLVVASEVAQNHAYLERCHVLLTKYQTATSIPEDWESMRKHTLELLGI